MHTMKAKELMQWLLAPLKGPGRSNTKHREFFFNQFYVAGYRYYDGTMIEDSLLEGKNVRFKREPQCPQDPEAVEVYAGTRKLGYIPRKDNAMIAKLLDEGITIKGRICKRNFDDQPRRRIKISAFKEV